MKILDFLVPWYRYLNSSGFDSSMAFKMLGVQILIAISLFYVGEETGLGALMATSFFVLVWIWLTKTESRSDVYSFLPIATFLLHIEQAHSRSMVDMNRVLEFSKEGLNGKEFKYCEGFIERIEKQLSEFIPPKTAKFYIWISISLILYFTLFFVLFQNDYSFWIALACLVLISSAFNQTFRVLEKELFDSVAGMIPFLVYIDNAAYKLDYLPRTFGYTENEMPPDVAMAIAQELCVLGAIQNTAEVSIERNMPHLRAEQDIARVLSNCILNEKKKT